MDLIQRALLTEARNKIDEFVLREHAGDARHQVMTDMVDLTTVLNFYLSDPAFRPAAKTPTLTILKEDQ